MQTGRAVAESDQMKLPGFIEPTWIVASASYPRFAARAGGNWLALHASTSSRVSTSTELARGRRRRSRRLRLEANFLRCPASHQSADISDASAVRATHSDVSRRLVTHPLNLGPTDERQRSTCETAIFVVWAGEIVTPFPSEKGSHQWGITPDPLGRPASGTFSTRALSFDRSRSLQPKHRSG